MNDQTPFIGRSMTRREDRRLLTGRGQYIADLELPHMLHAVLVRSPHAHARIKAIDVSRAAAAPGVFHVLTGPELVRELPPVSDTQLALPSKWTALVQHKFINPQQPLLAHDKVRHVGEAVAVIVAENRYAAEDAAQLVELDLEPLPPVLDPEQALEAGATIVHDKFATNLIGAFTVGKGDADAVLKRAPRRLQRRFYHHRYVALPMECRGVVGLHDARTDTVTIWSATQVVHWLKREASGVLRLPEAKIRCVALDVGGGFGVKGHVYPEDLLIPYLARRLGRPVKWIEDRHEHMLCSCHSRDQIHDVEIGFDDDGRILALRDHFVVDCGAWNPIGAGIAYNTAVHVPGPYKIGAIAISGRIAATNKVPNAPYRGAGRPEAAFAMERSIDLVATELGLEPAEVRLRNMIPAAEMPYAVGMPYRDGQPIVLDGGDYPGALQKALAALGGVDAFRARQRAALQAGRYLGLGIGCYVEGTGVGPFESALVRIDPSGKIFVTSGACPQGQGMETIFSQVVADAWQVTPDDVVISLADTAAIAIGFGTLASRSTVTLSAAIHGATEKLRDKVFSIAANMLECAATDLELRRGHVGIVGVPGAEVSLAKVAAAARPGWDSGRPGGRRWRARRDLLFRAADRDLVLCGARGGGRGRYRARSRQGRELRHRPRLRRGGQSDAGRGPDRRRRRAGARRRAARRDQIRRRRPAADHDAGRLHAADRLRPAADNNHPPALAVAAQSVRRQRRRRRRPDRAAGGDRQRRRRRAAPVQGRVQPHAGDAAADRSGGPSSVTRAVASCG